MSERQRIAEELLGCSLSAGGYAPCPGGQFHTKGKGARDFRVIVDDDKPPTGFCFHSSCGDEVARFNKELRRRIWLAENGRHGARAPRGHWAEGVAQEPHAEKQAKPEVNLAAVEEFTRGVAAVDEDFLRRRSPLDVAGVSPAGFIGALYGADERVLIFTDQRSQGDFLAWRKDGAGDATEVETFRLSQTQGVKAVRSRLPEGAAEGVWYLVQPVTGGWAINPNSVKAGGEAKWSRRCEANVTAWRYFVLEADELPAEVWLRVLAAMRLPIVAIYTSGGRSVHALLKLEVASKAQWDHVRNAVKQLACPLGADPAALTAVRLSRMPGCKRGNRLQKLLYLDPAGSAENGVIWLKPEVRG